MGVYSSNFTALCFNDGHYLFIIFFFTKKYLHGIKHLQHLKCLYRNDCFITPKLPASLLNDMFKYGVGLFKWVFTLQELIFEAAGCLQLCADSILSYCKSHNLYTVTCPGKSNMCPSHSSSIALIKRSVPLEKVKLNPKDVQSDQF